MNLPSALSLAVARAVLVVIRAALITFIWSVKRHRDPRLNVKCDAPIADLVPSLAGLTQGFEAPGNAVEILLNGAFFDAMIEELGKAQHSVHFETFLWKEGPPGQAPFPLGWRGIARTAESGQMPALRQRPAAFIGRATRARARCGSAQGAMPRSCA